MYYVWETYCSSLYVHLQKRKRGGGGRKGELVKNVLLIQKQEEER